MPVVHTPCGRVADSSSPLLVHSEMAGPGHPSPSRKRRAEGQSAPSSFCSCFVGDSLQKTIAASRAQQGCHRRPCTPHRRGGRAAGRLPAELDVWRRMFRVWSQLQQLKQAWRSRISLTEPGAYHTAFPGSGRCRIHVVSVLALGPSARPPSPCHLGGLCPKPGRLTVHSLQCLCVGVFANLPLEPT